MIGTLVDQGDAAVTQGKITVTELATGRTQTVSPNETGLFRLLNLLAGRYSLTAEVSGFKKFEIAEIVLASSENRDLGKLKLEIGTVTEEVSVTAAVTPVQTSSSERSALIDANQLQDVALKGRDTFGYMKLIPGVVDTTGDRSLATPGAVQGITINGAASYNKNVSFDGVSQLDTGGNGSVYVNPSMDAVGEIRVLTNAFQAEFGKSAGGGINMVTKAGTKDFHGTAFWNRRHEDMNANSFFNNATKVQRPIYRYFIAGATIGGPAYIPGVFNTDKKKVFFFWSEEFTRVAQPTVTSTATLPTLAERNGDFSNSRNSAGGIITIKDPLTGTAFPNNQIPLNRINATGQNILKLFQQPNGYLNPLSPYSANFIAYATPKRDRRDDIVRIDANFIKGTMIYVRYGHDTSNTEQAFRVSPGVGPMNNFQPGYNWSGHVMNMITPTLVNEALIGVGHNQWGYVRINGDKDSNYYRTSSLNPATMRPLPSDSELYPPYLPSASFSGGAFAGGSNAPSYNPSTLFGIFPLPYTNTNDNYSFQDDINWVHGNHSVKAGVYYEQNNKTEPLVGALYAGSFNFGASTDNPIDTNHGFANALLGVFQRYQEADRRVIPDATYKQLEGYVQDNWRASRRLTIDAGIRWYNPGVLNDAGKPYAHFYSTAWDPTKAARLYWPTMVGNTRMAVDKATGQTTYASLVNTIVPGSGDAVNGVRVNGLTGKGDYTNFPKMVFGPRLGLAWDVNGDGKMAIRASFGIFYQRPNYNWWPGRGTQPVVYTPSVYYDYIDNLPNAAKAAAISPTAATSVFGDQKIERSHQVNFSVQRDIGFHSVLDVAYVGNFNRHAQVSRALNPIPQGAYSNPANLFNGGAINADLLRTAYPGMGAITYYADGLSNLNYHGLQTSLQHRMTKGLQFGASYTFSKTLGTCGTVNNNTGCNINDPYHTDRGWYYGPLPWDLRHVANFNYVYQIPGVSNKIAKHILNNWTLSGIVSVQSGAPVTPTCSSTLAGIQNSDPSYSGVGTGISGARCQQIADPSQFTKSFYTNFNTSAFTLAAPGTFGNTGIGILRQPGWWNSDVTLDKRIPLGKDGKKVVRARIEAYNLFNHTEFTTIGTTMQLGSVGGVVKNINTQWGQMTAANSGRVMSTTVRFEF